MIKIFVISYLTVDKYYDKLLLVLVRALVLSRLKVNRRQAPKIFNHFQDLPRGEFFYMESFYFVSNKE